MPATTLESRPRAAAGGRQKLRVLEVIGSMWIGGAENVVANLVRGLDHERFDVALCCTKHLGVLADQLRGEGVEVMHTQSPHRALRHATPLFVQRAISRFAPDVVHTHGTTAILHAGPVGMLGLLPPWVHTFHFGNYDALQGRQVKAEGFLCRRATQLVAVADPQRESIIRRHRVEPGRIATIVNGVSLNPHVADPSVAARHRAALGFAPDDVVVGTIAVLSEQKGITYLLAAARLLLDRHPNLRFLVVGGGRLEGALRQEAESLGFGGRLVFTGWRQDAAELMTVLDVFVMSSLWEAMPMVLLEAMGARRAIVVTDVGDNRRVVAEGRAGVVVPPKDPGALANAIGDVVSNPALAAGLRAAAYDQYTARFSVDRMVADHEDLYARMASLEGSRLHLSATRT